MLKYRFGLTSFFICLSFFYLLKSRFKCSKQHYALSAFSLCHTFAAISPNPCFGFGSPEGYNAQMLVIQRKFDTLVKTPAINWSLKHFWTELQKLKHQKDYDLRIAWNVLQMDAKQTVRQAIQTYKIRRQTKCLEIIYACHWCLISVAWDKCTGDMYFREKYRRQCAYKCENETMTSFRLDDRSKHVCEYTNMGADLSHFEQPLYPQSVPICGTESRFCLPHYVQLRLREKFWSVSGNDFKICDAADKSKVYFQCEGRSVSINEKIILSDIEGVPIVNMKQKIMSIKSKFRVYAGIGSEREICIIKSNYNIKAKLSTTCPDIINEGLQHHLVLKADWRDKKGVIFLGEPKEGGIPIARIFRPYSGRTILLGVDDYILEVAAGVDIAICVIMCIALNEHSRDNSW